MSQGIMKQGYLTKEGGSVKSWKRRWFVLKERGGGQPLRLEYYKTEKASNDSTPLGTINLEECSQITKVDSPQYKKNTFEISTPGRAYHMYADAEFDVEEWVRLLSNALSANVEAAGDGGIESAGYQGFLRKRKVKAGGQMTGWKRRYTVLKNKSLSWYKTEAARDALGSISLKDCIGVAQYDRANERSMGGQFSFEVALRDQVYIFAADSAEDLANWISVLEKALTQDDVGGDTSISHVSYMESKKKDGNEAAEDPTNTDDIMKVAQDLSGGLLTDSDDSGAEGGDAPKKPAAALPVMSDSSDDNDAEAAKRPDQSADIIVDAPVEPAATSEATAAPAGDGTPGSFDEIESLLKAINSGEGRRSDIWDDKSGQAAGGESGGAAAPGESASAFDEMESLLKSIDSANKAGKVASRPASTAAAAAAAAPLASATPASSAAAKASSAPAVEPEKEKAATPAATEPAVVPSSPTKAIASTSFALPDGL